jgi:hypothetical protein
MGYNTSVIVLNDAMDFIKEDPDFGKNLVDAIQRVRHGETIDIAVRSSRGGVHCNAVTVIETHHADNTSVVTFGGNCGQVIQTVGGWNLNMNKVEDKVKLLTEMAESVGYTLRKKPAKKVKHIA